MWWIQQKALSLLSSFRPAMKLVIYDETINHSLPYFLAMEEYFARTEFTDDYFFMWQVDPTVIIGRNQLLEKEIDTAFCRRNNIRIFRRKSGGGAVFADRNNIMFSYITSSADGVATVFSDYTSRIALLLRGLGLDASESSRNDVTIKGQKVSGNAFYHVGKRSIVHGTMLYDTDRQLMAGALTPSASKLESKGVSSVRSRITTLREHLPDLTIDEFKRFVSENLCDEEPYRLSSAEESIIDELALPYHTTEWLTKQNPAATLHREERIAGVGEIQASVTVSHGKITAVNLSGDFFMSADIDSSLLGKLRGVAHDRDSVCKALADVDVSEVIPNLTNEKLIELITWKN